MTISVKRLQRQAKMQLKNFQRDYTDTLQIDTSPGTIGRIAVLAAIGSFYGFEIVPWRGTTFFDPDGEFDERAVVKEIQTQQTNRADGTTWAATVTWSTETEDEKKQADYPHLKPPVWSANGRIVEQPAMKDLDNTPILTSALVPYQTPMMIGACVQQWKVEINRIKTEFPSIADIKDHIDEYINKTNSAPWQGFDAFEISCDSIDMSEDNQSGFPFWKLVYNFTQASADQPDRRSQTFLDCGLEEIYDDGPPVLRRRIRDRQTGQPVSSVVPLNGLGRVLDNPLAGVSYKTYVIRRAVDFRGIIA